MHPVISSELIFLDYNILVFIFSSKKKNKPTLKEPLFSFIFSILEGGILLQWLIKMRIVLLAIQDSLIILSLVITCQVNSLSVSLGNSPLFPQGQVFPIVPNHSSIFLKNKLFSLAFLCDQTHVLLSEKTRQSILYYSKVSIKA